MEEIDILDQFGQFTGETASRERAHAEGLWHAGVVVFIVSPDYQRVLLQKRSEEKTAWPGCWDVSAGGHLDAGEDAVNAIARETKEELGLDISESEFRYLGTTLSDTKAGDAGRIRHVNVHFMAVKDLDPADLVLQTEEVADAQWVEIDELKRRIENGYEGLTRKDSAYAALLRFLEHRAN